MTIFTASFAAVAVSTAQDLFEITAPSNSRVAINGITLGQYSDFGDAAAELISINILRGSTAAGSAGSTLTPTNLEPWSRASDCVVTANNTTVASTTSAVLVYADTFNVAAGWFYDPPDGSFGHQDERIKLKASQRLTVRLASVPADAITMNGTLIFEELGQSPQ